MLINNDISEYKLDVNYVTTKILKVTALLQNYVER
jgi:hypothetical protein